MGSHNNYFFLNKIKSRLSSVLRVNQNKLVANNRQIESYLTDESSPVLVSFPRTGSHWLRMMLELYFDRPLLARTFFKHESSSEPLLLHTHDLDLKTQRKNVIYLFRDPRPTIFSQMMYHQETTSSSKRVFYWANLYAKHAQKWIFEESFSEKKTLLSYECLVHSLSEEFNKATFHLNEKMANKELDIDRLNDILQSISRVRVKEKTSHDPKVISSDSAYDKRRQNFEKEFSASIISIFLDKNPGLEMMFLKDSGNKQTN